MERNFPPYHRPHFRRQYEPPFHQNNRFNENFWEGNHFPEKPRPEWKQPHPNHHWKQPRWHATDERYRDSEFSTSSSKSREFDNFERGNFPSQGYGWNNPKENFHNNRPYGGYYRRFKGNFSEGRGKYQRSTRPSCLVNMMPNTKENSPEKIKPQSVPTKIKTSQEDATGQKKADSPKVVAEEGCLNKQAKTEDKVPEDPPGLPSSEFSTKACTDTTESFPTVQKQEASVEVLQVPEIKQESSLSDPSDPSAALEPLVLLETREDTNSLGTVETEQKPLQSELKESPDAENSPNCTVPIPSTEAPKEEQVSLETKEDLHTTGEKKPVLVKESPTADHSCNFNSSLAVTIPFLSETTGEHQHEGEKDITQTQNADNDNVVEQHQACIAVVIRPGSLSDICVVPMMVKEAKNGMQSSLQVYPGDTASFHTGNIMGWTSEGCQESPWSVNHPGKCDKNLEQGTGLSLAPDSYNWKCDTGKSYTCFPKSQYSSNSRHSRTDQAPTGMHTESSGGQLQELSSQHREQHSESPPRKKEDSLWTNCNQSCHNKCYCGASQENFQEKDSCSRCLTHKINHRRSLKERKKPYRVPKLFSSKNPSMKMKRELAHLKKTKMAGAPSDKGAKSAKRMKKARKEQAGGASLLSGAAEKIQPELIQMTKSSENEASGTIATDLGLRSEKLGKRSAVILATKEKIEQNYQRVVLNFAAVTTMLLEIVPSMEASMELALRATLRKIGNHYECMLRNFIDSYDLANAS